MTRGTEGGRFQVRRFADELAQILRQRILAGDLQSGQRLNEVQLAKEYGISRSPIREALQVLSGEDLVTMVAGKGAFVGHITVDQARELGAVREALETHAVRLVFYRFDDYLDTLLEESVEVDESVYAEGDEGRLDFHRTMLRSTGNATLEQAATAVTTRLRLARSRSVSLPGRLRQAQQEHADILGALRARDRDDAVSAMRLHLQRATDNACAALAKNTP